MRTKLLLSTAAVALMLTAPAAFAQSNQDKKPEAAKEQTHQGAKQEQRESAKHEERAQQQNENKAAESRQSKPEQNKAAQSEQPKQQQQKSASERPQHEQAKSEKNAQSDMKEQSAQKQNAEHSAKDSKDQHNRSATTKQRSTTGQSTSEQPKPSDTQKNATTDQPKSSPSAAQKSTTTPQSTATDNKANPTNSTASSTNNKTAPNTNTANSRTNAQQNATSVNAQITPEKQTRISETISRTHDVAPPVRDLHVSINIGTRVPQHVHLHRLPSEIVSIEPAYREYDYFTTEQDIVIVNPHTREVVTMVPRDASRARAEVGGSSSTQVYSGSGSMGSGGMAASSTVGMSGSPPCQVMRREASGQIVPVNPSDLSRSTTGTGSTDRNQLSVTVQAPNGQSMPPIALPDQTGQIVVATDNGDCKITIEPGAH